MWERRSLMGLAAVIAVAVCAPVGLAQCPGPLLGDLDADCDVDLADLAGLLAHYGSWGPLCSDGDLTGDGYCGLDDLAMLLGNYGTQYPEWKLVASDGSAGQYFGRAVAVSGNTATLGTPREDDHGSDSGAAYVFHFNGSSWVEQAKLLASDGESGDQFGTAVAVCGDTVAISAVADDDNGTAAGAVYVFRYDDSSWIEEAKLLASDGAAGDQFGWENALALSGDTVLVGTQEDDNENGGNAGAAYVFRHNDNGTPDDPDDDFWQEEAKLLASDGGSSDHFGRSVGILGDTAAVGAQGAGCAYVFRRDGDTWSERTRLLPSDGMSDFGAAAAASDGTLVIGARGAAYVFERPSEGWPEGDLHETAKLTASDAGSTDWFGYSVAISGDSAIVGAHRFAGQTGSAYVFQRDGSGNWEESKVPLYGCDPGDWAGYSVTIDGSRALVSAHGDDDNGSDSGAAYVFSLGE